MSEQLYPFIAAWPPEESAGRTSYLADISAGVEVLLTAETDVLQIWSDPSLTVADADGHSRAVGAIYLPCEGAVYYDPASGTVSLYPIAGARDLLSKALRDAHLTTVAFSHFTIANLQDVSDAAREALEKIPADDLTCPVEEAVAAFLDGGTACLEIASDSYAGTSYYPRSPLYIGTGDTGAAAGIAYTGTLGSASWQCVRIAAYDTDGNTIHPLTVLNLMQRAAALAEVDEYHPLWTALDFIDDSRLMDESYSSTTRGTIDTVVLHFSSDVVENPSAPYDLDRIIAIYEAAGVSTHYLIDRDGRIYKLVDESRSAWHAGNGSINGHTNNLNSYSIGIEIMAIGTAEEMIAIFTDDDGNSTFTQADYDALSSSVLGYTDAQYAALVLLLEDIVSRNPGLRVDRTHIVGHDEYAAGRKHDPGDLFSWADIGLPASR